MVFISSELPDPPAPQDGYCIVNLADVAAFEVFRATDTGQVYVSARLRTDTAQWMLWRGDSIDAGRAWLNAKLDDAVAYINEVEL